MKLIFFVPVLAMALFSLRAHAQESSAAAVVVTLPDLSSAPNWDFLQVSSGSMEPTLPRYSYVLSEPASSTSAYLHRGTVVFFLVKNN